MKIIYPELLNYNFIYQKYIIENLSSKELCDLIGCTNQTFNTFRRKLNIPKRINYKNIAGKRSGKLIAISPIELDNIGNMIWKCKCDCGNYKNVSAKSFNSKATKSCGCLKPKSNYLRYYNSIISGAKSRNIEVKISLEYIINLLNQQDFKCALSGLKIELSDKLYSKRTASLDRIDSSKSYEDGNVQWVHRDINEMKWDLDEKDFMKYINDIYNFNNLKNFNYAE